MVSVFLIHWDTGKTDFTTRVENLVVCQLYRYFRCLHMDPLINTACRTLTVVYTIKRTCIDLASLNDHEVIKSFTFDQCGLFVPFCRWVPCSMYLESNSGAHTNVGSHEIRLLKLMITILRIIMMIDGKDNSDFTSHY